ncbi:glycosyltransferase family 2 protein [Rhizobium sp. VS19-DR104.2]|uniref:glycosyltransferase family 2 protein n=1 Tax=unclassified Rhizobium TaxID=2613769 RepID=UPI001CC49AE8|nr:MULTISPECIES: glycosyltransferase family 2 protein [unclassified Rhizobium]MBZ5763613.1 glycosyltransferase family 2 protein [Rhizobium sp. VS19-DR96]MBZ5769542.1 glycosyltransferase family 2 protein [Rhizobium sp. VS19-DR129.2]MBZ5777109.1 glycosyltransferase family 2 protein [Rhizobium sp. VS19-DRK62.2]MBZ5788241.1 glycosyltransferase family 2 protein [Rhizobium sp. VS19-DR121]MBZ5805673.1 glycosyltransferase family 2 protein [Rhizobium sp. VS19-DR181]
MPGYSVAICIPTFRRPAGLARCLHAISGLKTDTAFQIVVADNDVDGREGIATCRAMSDGGFGFDIVAVAVSERGIAQARNALVAETLKNPDIQFIAMIDDDEWPEPQWLQALMDAQRLTHAEVVGGPVQRIFEKPVPRYLAAANLADFSKMKTGPIDWVDATSNVLFAASAFRTREAPWFDPVFGLLGGEDTDMLLSFKLAGTKFAWAHDATVLEDMPVSRSSTRWMLKRAYRIGNTYTLVHLKHRPPGFSFAREAFRIAGTLCFSAATLVVFFWHPAKRFEAARLGARVLGKLSGFFGYKHVEYAVTHGG